MRTLDGAAAYHATDFLADVRKGIWSETYGQGRVKIDAYRRNLQRAYVETLSERVNGRQAAGDDVRAFFRGELKTLDSDLRTAVTRATDRETRLHLEDVRTQIARALDPAIQERISTPGGPATAGFVEDFDVSAAPDACWIDYAIRRPGAR
jgi:hypothetical protein